MNSQHPKEELSNLVTWDREDLNPHPKVETSTQKTAQIASHRHSISCALRYWRQTKACHQGTGGGAGPTNCGIAGVDERTCANDSSKMPPVSNG